MRTDCSYKCSPTYDEECYCSTVHNKISPLSLEKINRLDTFRDTRYICHNYTGIFYTYIITRYNNDLYNYVTHNCLHYNSTQHDYTFGSVGSSFRQTSKVKKPEKATLPIRNPIQSFHGIPARVQKNHDIVYIETYYNMLLCRYKQYGRPISNTKEYDIVYYRNIYNALLLCIHNIKNMDSQFLTW